MNERIIFTISATLAGVLICITIANILHNKPVNLTTGKECTSVTTGGIK